MASMVYKDRMDLQHPGARATLQPALVDLAIKNGDLPMKTGDFP